MSAPSQPGTPSSPRPRSTEIAQPSYSPRLDTDFRIPEVEVRSMLRAPSAIERKTREYRIPVLHIHSLRPSYFACQSRLKISLCVTRSS